MAETQRRLTSVRQVHGIWLYDSDPVVAYANVAAPIILAGHTQRGEWDATCGACARPIYWQFESHGRQRCSTCGQLNAGSLAALAATPPTAAPPETP